MDAAFPNIWSYLNYREYLRAFYEMKKAKLKGRFSYRIFSEKTGIRSPNYLKLIVDGMRNLTPSHAKRVATYCGLDGSEKEYLLALVRWNQAKPTEDKTALWTDVLRKRAMIKELELSTTQLSVLTHNQTVAVFEMLRLEPKLNSSLEIANRLREKVSSESVEESLRQLEKIGVIKKQGSGFEITQKTLRSTEDIPSESIRDYHRQVIVKGIESLETVPVEEREFISTTVAVSKADIPRLKEHIREIRNLVLSESENTLAPEEVYQLNIQLFPLTQKNKDKKS